MTDHQPEPEPFPPAPVDGAAVRPEDGDQADVPGVDEDQDDDGNRS